MRKGVSLPINMIVILAISVIVLLALVALFLGEVNPAGASVTLEKAYSDACLKLRMYQCNLNAIDRINVRYKDVNADGEITEDELSSFTDICNEKFGPGEDNLITCVKGCGCQIVS